MIEELLAKEEGKTLEFKENTSSLPGIVKSVIAFSNTAGGIIVIGVRDKTKEVVGLSHVLQEEEKLASVLADSIAPLLIPEIEFHTYRNRELIVIRVPHIVGPYYLKKSGLGRGTYVRLGSTNRIADEETLNAIKRLSKNISYDELPCVGSKFGKAECKYITDLFAEHGKHINENQFEQLGITSKRLGKSYPTNGGILLFSQERNTWFPDAMIQCVRFAGNDRDTIIDQQDITTDLISAAQEIINFVERNTMKGMNIGRITREDVREYPPVAVREAVVNAILHTDYAMVGSAIQIAIFSDRIEITSPGGLPFGLTIEFALAGVSRFRNRIIGRMFRQLTLIEKLGSGLRRIIKCYKDLDLKLPIISEINNHFRVTLYSTKEKVEHLEVWQEQLIRELKTKRRMGTKSIAVLWSITERTARDRLKIMLQLGLIERVATSPKDPMAVYVLPNINE